MSWCVARTAGGGLPSGSRRSSPAAPGGRRAVANWRDETVQLSLKFDLRAPAFGADPADLYAAALDMCSWADAAGFDCVRFLEHHGSDDGYCPSPLVMAAAAAARTSRIRIRVRALILPLHDPLRIAEDAAVVDVISRGRLELVVAAGYVQSEFAMFG